MELHDAIKKMKQTEAHLKRFVNTGAPKIAAEIAVDLFKKNFQNEGFFDSAWKRRKTPAKNPRRGKNSSQTDGGGLKILTRTGNLRRSIQKKIMPGGIAEIYSDAPYAAWHNEGTERLPRRQFIGEHPMLLRRIRLAIQKGVKAIFP
jgi:phage gpG-like protein